MKFRRVGVAVLLGRQRGGLPLAAAVDRARERLDARFDPERDLPAHLWLVEPADDLDLEELDEHLDRIVRAWGPFPFALGGPLLGDGGVVVLAVSAGAADLLALRDDCCTGPLDGRQPESPPGVQLGYGRPPPVRGGRLPHDRFDAGVTLTNISLVAERDDGEWTSLGDYVLRATSPGRAGSLVFASACRPRDGAGRRPEPGSGG